MYNLILSRYGLSVCAATVLLAGCSGSRGSSFAVPTSIIVQSPTRLSSDLARIGIPAKYNGLRDLYVSDEGGVGGPKASIDILTNKGYGEAGQISKGIKTPGGNFLDKNGNFYVADQDAVNIKEYAPGSSSPMFIYNKAMISPEDVSVDRSGNVYEADDGSSDSFINEYMQGRNTVVHTCDTGFEWATGVAVDQKGDVFVDVVTRLIEFKGGLTSCAPTMLTSLNSGAGMALDDNHNIIVCDYNGTGSGTVDVVAPPYVSITKTLASGFFSPISVRINKANTRAFVSDLELGFQGQVFVLHYPSGAVIESLGRESGIYFPFGAVDGPNAVY